MSLASPTRLGQNARPAGADMTAMLHDGALDAIIFGNELPDDPAMRTVFPDPAAAAEAFWARHGVMPVNHLLCVKQDLAEQHPDLVVELVDMFGAARGDLALGRGSMRRSVELAYRFCAAQGLLKGGLQPEQIWDGCPPGLLEDRA